MFQGDAGGDRDIRIQWLQHDVYGEALDIITGSCQEHLRRAHTLLDDWEAWDYIDSYDHRTMQRSHDLLAAVWRFRHEFELRQLKLPIDGMTKTKHSDVVEEFIEKTNGFLRKSAVSGRIVSVGAYSIEIIRNDVPAHELNNHYIHNYSRYGYSFVSRPQCPIVFPRQNIKKGELLVTDDRSDFPGFIGHWLSWLRKEVESWVDTKPDRIRLVARILRNQNQPAGYRAEDDLSTSIINGNEDVPWINYA